MKADALEAWELEKWHSERQQDLLQKEAKFKFNKQQELVALQKRIQTGREEQKKQRHLDLERYVFQQLSVSIPMKLIILLWLYRLLQRYQNVKAELEAQQNLERIRMEKMVAAGGVAGFNGGGSTKRAGSKSMKRGSSTAPSMG